MRNNCPTNDLLKYINSAIKNPKKALPKNLIEHAKECDSCNKLLASPKDWEAFISICERKEILSNSKIIRSTHNLKEGQICRLKISGTTNSAFILITDTSSLKDKGYIRVSPIAVSPLESDIDKETDIIISASKMPTGLPSLIEWWNDRPVMAKTINKTYGSLSKNDYNRVKKLIKTPQEPKLITKSIFAFREIEKAKGNQMSATFLEKYYSENLNENEYISKQPSSKSFIVKGINNSKTEKTVFEMPDNLSSFNSYDICFVDLFPANEELRVAAASSDIYTKLKEYFNKNKNGFKIRKMNDRTDSFTIENTDQKPFILIITYKDGKENKLESNDKGRLYLKEGLKEFEKIEFRPK